MFFSSRSLACLLLALTLSAMAQTPSQPGTATITGMVKVGEAPAAGVPVALIANQIGQANRQGGRQAQGNQPQNQPQNLIQTVTDENGIYRFTGLNAGGYRVMPMTETLVTAAGNAQGFGGAGKAVNVSDGQTVSQIDFAMARGGVITGRVTDNNGRPIIAERLNLMMVNETGQARPTFGGNRAGVETDDRGVYRAYGLPAGKYLVSAGNDGGNRIAPGQVRRANYPKTFYPSATEQAEAQVVEVTAGSETEGIDIVLAGPMKAFAVVGRAVDAQTGQPVSGVPISVAKVARSGRGAQMPSPANTGSTNEKGEFRIAGLLPGTYSVSVPAMNFASGAATSSEYFSEPTSFEITSDDTSGVELRVHRGASITGTIAIEGSNDPSLTARLSQLMIFATSRTQGQQGQGQRQAPGQTSGRNGMGQVGRDGIFRVGGLAPGVVRLNVNGGGFGGNGSFRVLRIERNGSPGNGDIEVTSGETVTGVRVVVAFASAVIQGRVVVSGGVLPAGTRLNVTARPVNSAASTGGGGNNARLEANGQFRIENLLPGTYEVRVTANTFGGGQGGGGGRGGRAGQGGQAGQTPTQPQIRIPEVRQTVTVTNGAPANVTLTLNLAQ